MPSDHSKAARRQSFVVVFGEVLDGIGVAFEIVWGGESDDEKRNATISASARKYNFSAGPAMLPLDVLEEAQEDLVNYKEPECPS